MSKRIKNVLIMLAMILTIAGCSQESQQVATSIASGEMKVTYIDIGQGDATLIQTKDAAMLIDTGEYEEKNTLMAELTAAGVEELDYLILTHPDADHIGAGDVVVENYPVKNVMMPDLERDTKAYEYTMEAIENADIHVIHPEVGEEYELGDARFVVIGPYEVSEDDTNNSSVSIKLVHGSNTFLFTGDAEEAEEGEMVSDHIDLECDVLKCGHHGSRTATSDRFLAAADPTWAVISCGEDNQYGFPHADVVAKLEDDDVQIYRTDTMGTVTAVSDGTAIAWNKADGVAEKQAEADAEVSSGDDSDKEAAEAVTYILNTNTKKIHLPDCSSVSTIAEHNREESTESIEVLEQAGYTGCKRCNP